MQDVTQDQFKEFIKLDLTSYKEKIRIGNNAIFYYFNENNELIAIDNHIDYKSEYKIRRDCLK